MRAIHRVLGCVCALAATGAAPAAASVTVSSFSLTPSSTQAGGSPDLPLHVALSYGGGDDAKELTLSLAPGLLADPTAVPLCTQAQLAAASCPAGSKVGSGTLKATATVLVLPVPIDAPLEAFMVEPNADEVARIGLVARPPLVPPVVVAGSARLRGVPDIGLDVTFADLPRMAAVVPITIDGIDLTLTGAVTSGRAFTRNPTACGLATTRLRVISHDAPATPAGAESDFTPTGCDSLDYSPALGASAVADAAGQGLELTATIAQNAGEAATKRVELSLPADAAARLSELGRACDQADPAACPASATIGSATVDVPLLPLPLQGRLVMLKAAAVLPELAIVLPNPAPLRLRGRSALVGGGLVVTFDGIPDIPIRRLDVKLDGGAKSLLQVTSPALCSGKPLLKGKLAGHNGKEIGVDEPLSVTGSCPGGGGGGTPPPTPTPAPPPTRPANPTTIASAQLTLRGLATRRPQLQLTITVPSAGVPLAGIELRLPSGLRVNKRSRRGVSVKANGRRVPDAARTSSRIRAALPSSSTRQVVITITRPALRVSRALRRAVGRRRPRQLTATVGLVNALGATRKLRPRALAR